MTTKLLRLSYKPLQFCDLSSKEPKRMGKLAHSGPVGPQNIASSGAKFWANVQRDEGRRASIQTGRLQREYALAGTIRAAAAHRDLARIDARAGRSR